MFTMILINPLKGGKMKQSLIKSFCPVCKRKAKNFIGEWIKIVNLKQLPENLVEERCPECVSDTALKIRLGSRIIAI